MNTANLQLEGVLLAMAALADVLARKGIVSRDEWVEALNRAEIEAAGEAKRSAEMRAAHVDGICFPIRFLRLAATLGPEERKSFMEIAALVGQTKPDH